MTDSGVTIAGFTIPSSDPVFLAIVAVHVPLAALAALTGTIAILSAKASGRHPRFGTFYFWLLSASVVSASALSFLRWAETYHLFVLGLLSFAAALVGRTARRKLWKRWATIHVVGMGSSFVLMLTAFYVDNGHQLPPLQYLPAWTYWALPTAIGALLIAWTVKRHPIVRGASVSGR